LYETASHETVLEVGDGVRVNGAVNSGDGVGDGLVRAVGVLGNGFGGTDGAVGLPSLKPSGDASDVGYCGRH
jgi:hypothetical protein